MRYDGVYLSIMYMMILFRGAKWRSDKGVWCVVVEACQTLTELVFHGRLTLFPSVTFLLLAHAVLVGSRNRLKFDLHSQTKTNKHELFW